MRLLALLFCALLVLPAALADFSPPAPLPALAIPSVENLRVKHPAIDIEGDVGLQGFALARAPVTGTPVYRPGSGVLFGSGTPADPYVIELLNVTGILVRNTSASLIIRDVDVKPNGPSDGAAFLLVNASHVRVDHVRVDGAGSTFAAAVIGGSGVVFNDSRVANASYALVAVNVADARFDSLDVTASDTAVIIEASPGAAFTGGNATGGRRGAVVVASPAARVEDARVAGVLQGLIVETSDEAVVTGDALAGGDGLTLFWTHGAHILDDTFTSSGIVLDGDAPAYFEHEIARDTIDGRPIRYELGVHDIVEPAGLGELILVESSNVTVANATYSHSTLGIEAVFSSDLTFTALAIDHEEVAIDLFGVSGVTVDDSTFTACRLACVLGIAADASSVERSIFRESDGSVGLAIVFAGSDDRVFANTMDGPGVWASGERIVIERDFIRHASGIELADAPEALVDNNTLFDAGISVEMTSDARIVDNVVDSQGMIALTLQYDAGTRVERNVFAGGFMTIDIADSTGDILADNRITGGVHAPTVRIDRSANETFERDLIEDSWIGLEVGDGVTNLTVDHTTFARTGKGPVPALTGEAVRVTSGARSDLRLSADAFVELAAGAAVANDATASTVDARESWWGCDAGPNAAAPGCATTVGEVQAVPWLTAMPDGVPPA